MLRIPAPNVGVLGQVESDLLAIHTIRGRLLIVLSFNGLECDLAASVFAAQPARTFRCGRASTFH